MFVQYDALGVKLDLEAADWETPDDARVRCVSLWST